MRQTMKLLFDELYQRKPPGLCRPRSHWESDEFAQYMPNARTMLIVCQTTRNYHPSNIPRCINDRWPYVRLPMLHISENSFGQVGVFAALIWTTHPFLPRSSAVSLLLFFIFLSTHVEKILQFQQASLCTKRVRKTERGEKNHRTYTKSYKYIENILERSYRSSEICLKKSFSY